MFIFLSLVVIALVLVAVQFSLTSKFFLLSNRTSPLESGFESLTVKMPTSTPFFFMAVLFVLFDLELLLLFTGVLTPSVNKSSSFLWLFIMMMILITLAMEWAWCGLKWQIS